MLIGELARSVQLGVDPIRFYARVGLLPEPARPAPTIAPVPKSILSACPSSAVVAVSIRRSEKSTRYCNSVLNRGGVMILKCPIVDRDWVSNSQRLTVFQNRTLGT
jgi:hypothetical protein